MDPEQIYEEVLKEEQGKGVSPPVAEGRAKAARARAEAGSPHPKDPKWWPGAQPHLEGGEDAGEAEAEEEAAEPAAEAEAEPAAEPAAEAEPAAPAEEEQAARPAPEETPEAAPAPAEPAPAATPEPAQPAAAQPAAEAQPAAAAVAAPAAEAEPARPSGVTHGTKTGTRLRPEDEVTTDAQFEGQEAMYERRKLIDDLVATGVPAVAAEETGRPRTPWLAVMYLIIPIVVIAFLAGQESSESEAAAPPPEETSEGGGGGPPALVASGTEWDTDTLTLPADGAELELTNEDPVVHNVSIYPDEQAATSKSDALFTGPDVDGGASETFEIDPIEPGTYTFICDYHTNMIGEVTVE